MGLLNRCFSMLKPTAEMPWVVWEVLSRLDNPMRWIYHQQQDRRWVNISSLRVEMGNPGSGCHGIKVNSSLEEIDGDF